MAKRIILSIICIVVIAGIVIGGFTAMYFLIPRNESSSSIDLPDMVEDPVSTETATEDPTQSQDNIYFADVHQSLTLREGPDSNAKEIAGLLPMTHLEVTEFIPNTNFALVTVLTGDKKSYIGYVNTDYITPLGDMPVRVDNVDLYE